MTLILSRSASDAINTIIQRNIAGTSYDADSVRQLVTNQRTAARRKTKPRTDASLAEGQERATRRGQRSAQSVSKKWKELGRPTPHGRSGSKSVGRSAQPKSAPQALSTRVDKGLLLPLLTPPTLPRRLLVRQSAQTHSQTHSQKKKWTSTSAAIQQQSQEREKLKR